MIKEKFITLNEFAKENEINKSLLHYYNRLGLLNDNIHSEGVLVFPSAELKSRYLLILKLKKEGKSLREIKQELC